MNTPKVIYNIIKELQLPIVILMVIGLIIAYRNLWINSPKYAIVTNDGNITSRNFGEFGLFVECKEDSNSPLYILNFTKEPDYFEISSREAAIPKVKHIEPNKYKVIFLTMLEAGGFLAEPYRIIKTDFKVQAF